MQHIKDFYCLMTNIVLMGMFDQEIHIKNRYWTKSCFEREVSCIQTLKAIFLGPLSHGYRYKILLGHFPHPLTLFIRVTVDMFKGKKPKGRAIYLLCIRQLFIGS